MGDATPGHACTAAAAPATGRAAPAGGPAGSRRRAAGAGVGEFGVAVVAWIALGIGVGFRVDGFFPALVGALIITIVESGPDRDPVRTWHDVITGDGGGGAERV